jgi:hypothetical protein
LIAPPQAASTSVCVYLVDGHTVGVCLTRIATSFATPLNLTGTARRVVPSLHVQLTDNTVACPHAFICFAVVGFFDLAAARHVFVLFVNASNFSVAPAGAMPNASADATTIAAPSLRIGRR